MVKLRLARMGKKNQPSYRLVAIKAKTKRSGEALEQIGFYNPRTQPSTFEFNKERVEYWLSVGAQPTETVARLLARNGVLKLEKKVFKHKPGRKGQERLAKAQAEAEAKRAEKAAAKQEAADAKAAAEAAKAEAVVEAPATTSEAAA